MMGRKQYLHELLREDQEPFQLKTYIADRRCQLRRPKATASTLQHLKKRKQPVCHHVCLFSFRGSPDFPYPTPPKSPCKSPTGNANTVFLQIPARTAAMLLDAAMRIQKQSCKSKTAASGEGKNVGSGLFGSFLKRLSISHWNKRRELASGNGEDVFVKRSSPSSSSSSSSPAGMSKNGYEINSRLSSAGWSEINLETSCSSRSRADSEEFVASGREEDENGEKCFCTCSSSTPSSPFRFSLQKSPNSSCHRTPEFLSPASSPTHHCIQETTSYEVEIVEEVRVLEGEEKEQFSPVSVLDPPFEDDDDDGEGRESEDGYDLECSYANVQRAKQQLLQKLRRFERLAELDPIELEKRMSEGAENEADDEDEECGDYYESIVENTNEEFLREVFNHLGFVHGSRKVPSHMKRFVSDIIAEEKNDHANEEEGSEVVMMKRVCRRLDSWKVVESNTIDMMVEVDLRREEKGWTRYDQEHIRETGIEIEDAIFGFLIEELSEELVS